MKRLSALFLSLAILFFNLLSLSSCREDEPPIEETLLPEAEVEGGEEDEDTDDKLKVPLYKDYERGTVDFSAIVYSRPITAEIIEKFNTATDIIAKNALSYEEQLSSILALEEDFNHFLTMYTYADIKLCQDSSDEYWVTEQAVTRQDYPAFSKAVEDLFVAAARSPHAERFEADYFGDGLIFEYADGGDYTDALVALMESEAQLESEYSAISTASVTITYMGKSDTLDNILAEIEEDHGKDSTQYSIAKKECARLYEKACAEKARYIYVELIKLRYRIADEYGYDSYTEVAYAEIYHDYTPESFIKFAHDIAQYILPVYARLNHFVFTPCFYSHKEVKNPGPNYVVNGLYQTYKSLDAELGEAYAYMLQHGLFDCARPADNRYDGAFSTYLDAYNAPFLFATLDGGVSDYTTLAHEFGHFFDAYINFGNTTSLDLSEVSSMALEFLTLSALKEGLSSEDYKYLTYTELESAMSAMIFQGFYALFEHYAYELDYEDITEENLVVLMQRAAEEMGLDLSSEETIEPVIITHTVIYPFYVQSYCTSAAVALDIYYTELESEGEGLRAYKELLVREDGEVDFEKQLEDAMLSSPFKSKFLKELADKIHYQVLGSHYFQQEANKGESAA